MRILVENQAEWMTHTSPSLSPTVAWKQVLTVFLAVVGPPAGAVLGFIATIDYSDCFIECSGHPQHTKGALLGALAVLLLLSGPLLAGLLVRKTSWVAATIAVPVLEVLFFLARAH